MKSRVVDIDRGLKGVLAAAAAGAKGAYTRVGILGDDERGGLHVPGVDLTIAEIAVVNEFGTEDGTIPARPAHRQAFDKHRHELEVIAFRALVRIFIDRKMTVEQGLNLLGLALATFIKNEITQGAEVPPPNAPSVIAAKGHKGEHNAGGKAQAAGYGVRTLVDTGATVGAISWAVTIGEDTKPAHHLAGG